MVTGPDDFDGDTDGSEFYALIGNDTLLPDEGPPVDTVLLQKLVAKQPLDKAVQTLLFRLIATYHAWNKAFMEVQLEQLRSRN